MPSVITNAIIELEKSPTFDFVSFLRNLSFLLCKVVCLTIYYKISVEELEYFTDQIVQSSIESVDLIINHNENINAEDFSNLIHRYPQISNINIYGVDNLKFSIDQKHMDLTTINTYSSKITDFIYCGTISPNHFCLNLPYFTESLAYNTCLNRKLCVDSEGNIKNCPAMKIFFGNIKNTTFKKILEEEGFTNLWNINKDKIEICKDCEFRHMCMDCRCFIKDPDNIYSQPAKCTYNPYICKWEGQDQYVPVEDVALIAGKQVLYQISRKFRH